MFPDDIAELAASVIASAAERGWTVATAESCTGGLVAAALTAIEGSSRVFDGGYVTYSNAAKTGSLSVSAVLIAQSGAVSEPVAKAMAEGARSRSGATLSVSITGIAGPGGGSPEKPVGRVHFACAGPGGTRHDVRSFGDIGREAVRLESVRVALTLLLSACEGP